MEQVAIEIITDARASVDNEISEVLSMLERIKRRPLPSAPHGNE